MVRKMMKLSSFEVAVLLIITATTIHYCTMWGSYWEKKMILNDHIDAVSKRKKQKAAVEHLTAAKDQIEYPSFKNLLPFLVVKGVFYFFMAIPAAIKNYNEGNLKDFSFKENNRQNFFKNLLINNCLNINIEITTFFSEKNRK